MTLLFKYIMLFLIFCGSVKPSAVEYLQPKEQVNCIKILYSIIYDSNNYFSMNECGCLI
jgi:hypothetical protein